MYFKNRNITKKLRPFTCISIKNVVLYFDLINKLNIYWIIFVWGSSFSSMVGFYATLSLKKLRSASNLAFYFGFFEIFYFLFILFSYILRKLEKIPQIRPIYHAFIYFCILFGVCILDLIYIYFIIKSLSYIYLGEGWLMLLELRHPILLCTSACGSSWKSWLVIIQPYFYKSFAQQVFLFLTLLLNFIFTFHFKRRREKYQK